ncbi:hypothetical protein SCUP515_01587 [Seiridium cupressi]
MDTVPASAAFSYYLGQAGRRFLQQHTILATHAWMEVTHDQKKSGKMNTPGLPFRRVDDTWAPHPSIKEESDYGQGWVVTELPAKTGQVGVNGYERPGEYPIVNSATDRGAFEIHKSKDIVNGRPEPPLRGFPPRFEPKCPVADIFLTTG